MNKTIQDLLKSVAPTIATALGGPLAGVAVRTLAEAVLEDPQADPQEVERYLGAMTSADLAALKLAELEFKARLEEAGVELEKVHARDRASARGRAAAMGDWTPSLLGVLIIFGFFGLLFYILHFGLPEPGGEVLMIMVGALGTMTAQVGNYFFGSSAGSASKNAIIERLKGSAK